MIDRLRFGGGLLAAASVVLMSLTIGAPAARAAGDAKCADVPEACASVVVTITGYGSGDVVSGTGTGGADGLINCHHALNVTSGSCRYDYYIAGTARFVNLSATGTYPDEVTPCMQDLPPCSGSQVIIGRNIARGGRYTFAFTLDVADPSMVTAHKSGSGAGRVESVNRDGINCGATCSWPFYTLLELELRATPSTGSTFVGWDAGGRCAGQDDTCIFQPKASTVAVTAIFALDETPPPVTEPPASSSPKPSPSPKLSPTPKPSSTPRVTAAPSRSPAPSITASVVPAHSSGPASPNPSGTSSASTSPSGTSGTTGPGASPSGPPSSGDLAAGSAGPGESAVSPSAPQTSGPVAVVVAGSPPATAGAPAAVPSSSPTSGPSAAADGGHGMWVWLLLVGFVVALAFGIRIASRKGVRS